MNKPIKRSIVITGGHHSSAIPIIEALKTHMPEVEIYWFGHKHSLKGDTNPTMEYLQVTQLGIPFYDLKAGKVYKTFDLGRLFKVPYGFFQALYLLYKLKPRLILSFGGYLAVPTVIAGFVLRIPSITHEQTLVVGYANKLISHFVQKIFISWPSSAKYFEKQKVIYSGIPLRPEIYKANSNSFEINKQLPTIYITAGKTGSHKINEVIKESLAELLAACNVIHQCGDHSLYNDFETLNTEYAKLASTKPGKYIAKKFVMDNEIGEVFTKANLVISRAGAHIISELLALEKPSILIPISWVSHNEQNVNADFLVNAGIAVKLSETELTKEKLLTAINYSLKNLSTYRLKDIKTKDFIRSDSTDIILAEVFKHLQE